MEVKTLTHPKLELSKKKDRPKNLAPIKVWFVGRIYKMHRKFDDYCVELRDPTNLMDHPSNMEIVLCWYQKAQLMNLLIKFFSRKTSCNLTDLLEQNCMSFYDIYYKLRCL